MAEGHRQRAMQSYHGGINKRDFFNDTMYSTQQKALPYPFEQHYAEYRGSKYD